MTEISIQWNRDFLFNTQNKVFYYSNIHIIHIDYIRVSMPLRPKSHPIGLLSLLAWSTFTWKSPNAFKAYIFCTKWYWTKISSDPQTSLTIPKDPLRSTNHSSSPTFRILQNLTRFTHTKTSQHTHNSLEICSKEDIVTIIQPNSHILEFSRNLGNYIKFTIKLL
jgi:hypothetical protein